MRKIVKWRIRYYIFSFILVAFIFIFLSFYTISFIKKYHYNHLYEDSLRIGEYYSQNITKAREAHQVVGRLLDEKLLVALRTTAVNEPYYDNDYLQQLAESLEVDEIYIYDYSGTIVYTNDKYLGWKALPGHPVHNFMISDFDLLVEDIRFDPEAGIYYKYAYQKIDSGFIQVGILATVFSGFLDNFEMQMLFKK